MRLKLLACGIFQREITKIVSESPHEVDVDFLPQELHGMGRKRMKNRLTQYLADVDETDYDALLLGYALCSGGIAGLSTQKIPMVIPRAHDCITLFLGSRKKYNECFFANSGTYYLTTGWFEQDNAFTFNPVNTETEMMPFYTKLAFIETGLEPDDSYTVRAQRIAEDRHWEFEKIIGDLSLLRQLIFGDWNEDFLVVPPGKSVQHSYGDDIITAT